MTRISALLALLALGTAGAQKVSLTYLHGFTGPDRPVMEDLVRKFNASHPNIEVRAQAQP